MKLSLITLNYNGAENTIKLLESLQNQTDSDFSFIVADNGSTDVQQLRDYCAGKTIHLIENGANLGFAGGNNPALRHAFKTGSDWAVLINNDTWVENDFVTLLKAGLMAKKGLAGIPIAEEGGGIAYSGRLAWLKTPTRQDFHVYQPDANVPNRYVIGAGMAISQEAFEKLGPMDENYFLYFEDIDYSYATQRAGIPVSYLSNPIIHHQLSTTSKKELGGPLIHRYHYRNALYFNFKNGPLIIKIAAIPWSVLIALHQIFKILTGNNPKLSRAILAGIVDFYQERMGRISRKIKVGIECEQIEDEIFGVGKIITKLLENIAARPELAKDFEFHLYFKSEIPKLPFLDNPIFHKKVIAQPFKHKSFVAYYYVLLPIQLWFERLDVMFFPSYMLPIIFFGNSVVMMTEDVFYEMRSKQQRFRHRLAYRVFVTWATWRADKIMAISETSKKELVRLFDIEPERIAVNSLAIDTPQPAGENHHGKYLLFVGQAFPRRHLEESLLAFEKITPDFPDLKFIIVGPDKYNPPKIKRLQHDINSRLGSERVIWHERVSQEELSGLYAHALATIYISSREAFGLPPLEGLAQGSVPVIAENALGQEIFGNNAVFVTNPDSVSEIAEALRKAMTNSALREKIKEHAPEIVRRYTWPAHTDRFIAMIKSMTRHD